RPFDGGARQPNYRKKVEALAKALGRPTDHHTAAKLMTLIGLACWPHAMPQLARFLLEGEGPEERHRLMGAQGRGCARRAVVRVRARVGAIATLSCCTVILRPPSPRPHRD